MRRSSSSNRSFRRRRSASSARFRAPMFAQGEHRDAGGRRVGRHAGPQVQRPIVLLELYRHALLHTAVELSPVLGMASGRVGKECPHGTAQQLRPRVLRQPLIDVALTRTIRQLIFNLAERVAQARAGRPRASPPPQPPALGHVNPSRNHVLQRPGLVHEARVSTIRAAAGLRCGLASGSRIPPGLPRTRCAAGRPGRRTGPPPV